MRNYRTIISVCVVLSLLVPALAVLRAESVAAQDDLPRFEPTECPFSTAGVGPVECGMLTVPEDRSQPDGPTIRLGVTILKSWSQSPAPDPLIYLTGGPGYSTQEFVQDWIAAPVRATRDLILLDQRGTGYSEPSLNCPEVETFVLGTLGEDTRVDDWQTNYIDAVQECHGRLQDGGADLSAYNSAVNAADVADLRVALGLESWNLYGISYGTRLALTVLRDHPDGVRSVVLDSVYPPGLAGESDRVPNLRRALDLLFADCAADMNCNQYYPDLETVFFDLVDRFNAEPVRVPLIDETTGETYEVLLTGDVVLWTVQGALYKSDWILYLPLLIYELHDGEYEFFAYIAMLLSIQGVSLSEGLYLSTQCHESYTEDERDRLQAQGEAYPELATISLADMEYAVCAVWNVDLAAPAETAPATGDIPTLVLSGQYDPVTPPSFGERAAENLNQSYVYDFPGMGHAITLTHDCPRGIMLAFLDDPATAPDASCIEAMGPPAFLTP